MPADMNAYRQILPDKSVIVDQNRIVLPGCEA